MTRPFKKLIGVCFTLALLLIGTSSVHAQYCDAASSNTSDDWLAGVNFAGIDNASGSTTYSDFTDISGIVAAGGTYEFTATIGNSGTWNQFVTVYIDWNQDEVFNEEDERYDLGNCAFDGCTVVGDILVPAATPGETRMRVIENWNGFVDEFEGYSCYSETYGEVEDYSLIVDGDCTPPSFVYDITDNCDSFTYNVQATLNDFSGNSDITIYLNRSDIGDAGFVTFEDFMIGQTVDIITDVPFGVTIEASIEGADPVCNQTRNWSEEGVCPPINNECETAIQLDCGETSSGSTENASVWEGQETCGTTASAAGGVWYSLNYENNAIIDVNTFGSSYDTKLYVYGGECGELVCITGNDDSGSLQSAVQFYVVAETTYYIYVAGFGTNTGDYQLEVSCESIFCEFPELTAVAVDGEGAEIEGCIPVGSDYRVSVTLEGGEGNDDFTVTVGDSVKVMTAPETHIFGLYGAGSSTTITAVGNQDPDCGADTSVNPEICPPENEECETAQAIACGETVSGSTIGASEAPEGIDFCNGNIFGPTPSVWYSITPAVASFVTVTESNASGPNGNFFDLEFFAYSGSCGGPYTCVGGANFPNNFTFTGAAGETYYILVTGFNNSQGTFNLTVDCIPDPCDYPELTVEAVLEGDLPIEGCLEPGTDVYVNVELTGGDGNDSFTVNANGTEETMSSPGTYQFGPFNAGTEVSVTAIGDDEFCSVSASATSEVCPPPNDICADALPLPCNGSYIGNTSGATDDVTCNFGNVRRGVWFSYTATDNVEISMETCWEGTNFDTDLSVFTGDDCDNLTCFTGFSGNGHTDGVSGCEFAGFAAGGPDAVFTAEAGVTYYVLLHGFGTTNFGDYELHVSCIGFFPCGPGVTAIATDAEGTPVEDCVDQTGEYYVMVTLTEDVFGPNLNDFYNVSVNGSDPILIAADGSGIVGPVPATEVANVVVSGVTVPTCGIGSTSISVVICPPSNDAPCDAIVLPVDGSASAYTNVDATLDAGEPTVVFNGNATVWFTFIGPESGRVNLTTCSGDTDFDTVLGLYEVGECGDYETYTLLVSNDEDFSCTGNQSTVETCVTPGATYYVQVSGFNNQTGVFDLTATEADGAICDCVLPDLGPDAFTFADTDAICDGEDQNFSLTFYAPEDLGSQDGMLYTYDWADNPGEPITILVTEATTVPEIFSLGTIVNITVSISDVECEDADGSIYPLSGAVTQNNPDCNPCGAPPGTPCEIEGEPGTVNVDCECIPVPDNDTCAGAIEIGCGETVIGSTVASTLDPRCGIAAERFGVWYTFTPDNNALAYLETCHEGTNFDTDFSVFTGPDCDNLNCYAGFSDDGYVDGESGCAFAGFAAGGPGAVFEVEAGVTYYILVHGFGAITQGDFEFSIACVGVPATIDGIVDWNSECGGRDIEVSFYNPGTDELVDSYTVVVNAAGEFTIPGVPEGTFDIIAKVNGYLGVGVEDVDIAVGGNALDLGAIMAGDMNGDNGINIIDVSVLNAAFGSIAGDSNFNPLTDMNCDGGVNIIDVSILNVGFGMTGVSPGEE